eukprot:15459372-Alexandrium_andersonii.AAC.1
MQAGPPAQAGAGGGGGSLRLHPPAMGQDLRWLLATQGSVTPEEAARAARSALGVELSGQS